MTSKNKLKVLQFGLTEGGAGLENAVRLLCLGLAWDNHDVCLVTESTRYAGELAEAGAQLRVLNLADRSARGFLRSAAGLRAVLHEFAPDIVHVHARSQTLVSLLAGRRPDCFTLHNSHLTHRWGILDSSFVRPWFPQTRRTIVLSAEAKTYVRDTLRVAEERIHVVPNGIDCTSFRAPSADERAAARRSFGADDTHTLGIYVGRYHEQKQPEAIVHLARALKAAGRKDVRLALVGGGALEAELREAIRQYDVADICTIHSWMNPPTAAYWAADAYLLPSRHEGYALTPVEALACGCPVVRTRTGGCDATILDGVTGFASDVDVADFVRVASSALADRDALLSMRSAARAYAVANLSIQKSIAATVGVYESILTGLNKVATGSGNAARAGNP
jgi:glycosyltransferase involved in cell wall biosynthesis